MSQVGCLNKPIQPDPSQLLSAPPGAEKGGEGGVLTRRDELPPLGFTGFATFTTFSSGHLKKNEE
jgi:hypothetical protein